MSVSRFVGSEANICCARCYSGVKYERALLDLVQLNSGYNLPEMSRSLVVFCRPFYLFFWIDRFQGCGVTVH